MAKLRNNFVVDVLLYIGFVGLLGTGLVLHYILSHGSGRLVGRGTGPAAGQKMITTLWGMTGDQWGQIHFWIAVGVLAVTAIHLILHWKWIVCVLGRKERPAEASGGRALVGLAGMFGILVFVLLPFLTPTQQATRNELLQRAPDSQSTDTAESTSPASEESIRGDMTLAKVQAATGVPYQYVLEKLNLPRDISPNERLGGLRRAHAFTIDDVRRIVAEYRP